MGLSIPNHDDSDEIAHQEGQELSSSQQRQFAEPIPGFSALKKRIHRAYCQSRGLRKADVELKESADFGGVFLSQAIGSEIKGVFCVVYQGSHEWYMLMTDGNIILCPYQVSTSSSMTESDPEELKNPEITAFERHVQELLKAGEYPYQVPFQLNTSNPHFREIKSQVEEELGKPVQIKTVSSENSLPVIFDTSPLMPVRYSGMDLGSASIAPLLPYLIEAETSDGEKTSFRVDIGGSRQRNGKEVGFPTHVTRMGPGSGEVLLYKDLQAPTSEGFQEARKTFEKPQLDMILSQARAFMSNGKIISMVSSPTGTQYLRIFDPDTQAYQWVFMDNIQS